MTQNVPLPMVDMLLNLGIFTFNAIAVLVFWKMFGKIKKKSDKYVNQRLIISTTVLLYMMYPNFIKLFFQLFSCKNYPPEKHSRLVGSLDTLCYTPEHNKWIFGLAVPVLVFIILAWPVIALRKLNNLRTTKENGLRNVEVMSTLGFLYDGFRMDYWYWELVVLIRKVSLSVVSVFLAISSSTDAALYRQGMAALLIMGTSLCVHLSSYPYENLDINRLEGLGLTVSALTLYGGMLTFDTVPNGYVQNFVSIAVVLMNLVWLFCVLRIMYSGFHVGEKVAAIFCKKNTANDKGWKDETKKDKGKERNGKVANDIEMTFIPGENGGKPADGGVTLTASRATIKTEKVVTNPLLDTTSNNKK